MRGERQQTLMKERGGLVSAHVNAGRATLAELGERRERKEQRRKNIDVRLKQYNGLSLIETARTN